jgi:nucleoside-diphosphate-sugar epimerase
MTARIFLAGASGAIGQPLSRMLMAAGHSVVGTTRSPQKAEQLRALGVEPVIVDVFDAAALSLAVEAAKPEVVIHQLTDLPRGLDAAQMAKGGERNARIRREGTENLVKAALAAGARRFIAQSISWLYASGPKPHAEDDLLDLAAIGPRAISVAGVAALERLTLRSPPLEGLILRYGHLYGAGTGEDVAKTRDCVHVDAAAHAALLAIDHGASGIYNVAEPNEECATDKAQRELGWRPDFRLS